VLARIRAFEPELPVIMQALLNLLGNAVAHTSPGGHVWLRATAGIGGVAIEVSDDGSGTREEDLSRVFDRFYRAQGPRRGAGGGSGLGLAITRRLVELHNGEIAASNRPEGGAKFTIMLKRIPTPPDA
jgi:signal transduction histidine kinase